MGALNFSTAVQNKVGRISTGVQGITKPGHSDAHRSYGDIARHRSQVILQQRSLILLKFLSSHCCALIQAWAKEVRNPTHEVIGTRGVSGVLSLALQTGWLLIRASPAAASRRMAEKTLARFGVVLYLTYRLPSLARTYCISGAPPSGDCALVRYDGSSLLSLTCTREIL